MENFGFAVIIVANGDHFLITKLNSFMLLFVLELRVSLGGFPESCKPASSALGFVLRTSTVLVPKVSWRLKSFCIEIIVGAAAKRLVLWAAALK